MPDIVAHPKIVHHIYVLDTPLDFVNTHGVTGHLPDNNVYHLLHVSLTKVHLYDFVNRQSYFQIFDQSQEIRRPLKLGRYLIKYVLYFNLCIKN